MPDLRRRPALSALITGTSTFLALLLVAGVTALIGIRSHVTSASEDLTRVANAAGDLPERVLPTDVQAFMAAIPAPTILTGRFGQEVARTGPATGVWDRGALDWVGSLATRGADVRALDSTVEVKRQLANGRSLTVRQSLGRGATTVSGATALVAAALSLLIALAAGLVAYVRRRKRVQMIGRVVTAAETVAAGRPLDGEYGEVTGELARLGGALAGASERLTHLSDVADRQVSMLSTAIEPLPIPVTGRGPSGGRLRNVAMERLLEELPHQDRAQLDEAVKEGLDATGPSGSRVTFRDGRIMEVDGWSVPGGRIVSVAERTEQDRLAQLRHQIEGSAIRQLRAPVDEIKARGAELYKQLPASGASTLRALFAATDRLDRVVRMLLRGTDHDPALRPPRRETFGVAGLLWGLVHDWDAALRQRALRVELDIAPDLPDVRTDPALVEEILTELVDNAAKYTPRGGTVSLAVRATERVVSIEVSDTGTGFSDEDVPHATQRFFRGRHSESIPGAGLGLGVASALAQRLGGALVVEPGPGGKVRLELQAVSAAQPVAATTA